MARKLLVMMEGRALFEDDGAINEQAFLNLLNAMRQPGEPEVTLEECRAALADDTAGEPEADEPSTDD